MKSIWKQSGKLAGATCIALLCSLSPEVGAHAGDSLYGTVTAVKRADLITLDYGAGSYDIRLAGVAIPDDAAIAERATQYAAKLLLNRKARLRFEGRTTDGVMVGRIYTDDPDIGINDVGLELVRAGMAVPEKDVGEYKYGELDQAVREAQSRKYGVWKEIRQ